jgi:hypothetical protein
MKVIAHHSERSTAAHLAGARTDSATPGLPRGWRWRGPIVIWRRPSCGRCARSWAATRGRSAGPSRSATQGGARCTQGGRIVAWDARRRSGPEFGRPGAGRYIPVQVKLTARGLRRLSIQPLEAKEWVVGHCLGLPPGAWSSATSSVIEDARDPVMVWHFGSCDVKGDGAASGCTRRRW